MCWTLMNIHLMLILVAAYARYYFLQFTKKKVGRKKGGREERKRKEKERKKRTFKFKDVEKLDQSHVA